MTDEFHYERIEADKWFGPLGKAENCYLIPAEYCRDDAIYHKYKGDQNNRSALSRDLRGFYDGLNVVVPVMNIFFDAVSSTPVIEDRYEVKLIVHALTPEYGRLISHRLKEDASISTDRMEMKTSVFVTKPNVFCNCLEWKAKHIEKMWNEYYETTGSIYN